jgi:hypothetical protein
MGASTLLCMDMEKDNIRTSSITKSYTCNMDIMLTIVYIICNVNKPEIRYGTTLTGDYALIELGCRKIHKFREHKILH